MAPSFVLGGIGENTKQAQLQRQGCGPDPTARQYLHEAFLLSTITNDSLVRVRDGGRLAELARFDDYNRQSGPCRDFRASAPTAHGPCRIARGGEVLRARPRASARQGGGWSAEARSRSMRFHYSVSRSNRGSHRNSAGFNTLPLTRRAMSRVLGFFQRHQSNTPSENRCSMRWAIGPNTPILSKGHFPNRFLFSGS